MRALILLSVCLIALFGTGCENLGALSGFEDPGDTDEQDQPNEGCGNGERDPAEECDGSDFGDQSCVTFGHLSGDLSCTNTCYIDDSTCNETVTVPTEWACAASLYATGGGCDCGCGAVDPDCSSQGVEACTQCDASGSCALPGYGCPSDIDPFNNAVCKPAQCGDGVITVPELCDGFEVGLLTCEDYGFSGGGLTCNGSCDDVDTSTCNGASVPSSWTCDAAYYNAFDGCDCGCGAVDPDCADATVGSCEFCTDTGACSGSCADIDPVDNSICITAGVNCGNDVIDAGEVCDGTDLGGNDCTTVGTFIGGVLGCNSTCSAFQTSSCTTAGGGGPPPAWTCDSFFWADGLCDCGCGALDVADCADSTVGSCDYCDDPGSCDPLGGCPGDIDPLDNSICVTGTGTGGGPTAMGDVIVTELMPDPDTLADSAGEWFEIHNPGTTTMDLTGCEFRSDPANVLSAGTLSIPPGGYLTFAGSSAPGFTPDATHSTGSFSLRNGDDTFEIWCDPGSGMMQIDAVAYDDALGWPLVKGSSLNLDSGSLTHTANDSATNWCAGTSSYNGDFGTPGAANAPCP